MGKKKMKLPLSFLFRTPEAPPSWPWPSCGSPKTLSFRATVNSSEPPTDSPEQEDSRRGGESVEAVIRGLRSRERLFFEPGETSSILDESKNCNLAPFRESVVVSMDSRDPFLDFKSSMEEMVAAHGLNDWEHLEELLHWYLRVNGKSNHGYIIGAFVDLLVGLTFASETSSSSSCSDHDRSYSPVSQLSFSSSTCSTSPHLSLLEAEDEKTKALTQMVIHQGIPSLPIVGL
ncbi:hypothetical protein NMG60_11008617 [Bertholletia excelsa]